MLSIGSGSSAAQANDLGHIAIGDFVETIDGVNLRGLAQGILFCERTIFDL